MTASQRTESALGGGEDRACLAAIGDHSNVREVIVEMQDDDDGVDDLLSMLMEKDSVGHSGRGTPGAPAAGPATARTSSGGPAPQVTESGRRAQF